MLKKSTISLVALAIVFALSASIVVAKSKSKDSKENVKIETEVKKDKKSKDAKTEKEAAKPKETMRSKVDKILAKGQAEVKDAKQNLIGGGEIPAPEPTPVEPEPSRGPNVILADASMSNLQLSDPSLPVYDKFTRAERRANGMSTALPNLTPYRQGKVAYLTFDDGPDDVNTPFILDTLKAYGVPATFYVVGRSVQTYPDVVKRMYEEGHAIGDHSYNHDYDNLYASSANFIGQMERTDEIIKNLIGVRPLIMRAPGGSAMGLSSDFWKSLKDYGYVEHGWNASAEDSTGRYFYAHEFIANIDDHTSKYCGDTAIVLMHSNYGKGETAKALPQIIDLLKAKGYSFGVITPMTPQPW